MPVMLSKRILQPGTYYPSGDKPVVVTPQRIDHWAEEFGKMTKCGMSVPVPLDHPEPGDKSYAPVQMAADKSFSPGPNHAGWLKGLRKDADGWLVADMEIADDKTAKGIQHFSPAIATGFTDGAGRTWNDVITHMAAVYYPVAHDQPKTFEKVAPMGVVFLSLNQRREKTMTPIVEMLSKLGGVCKAACDQHPNKVQLMALPPAQAKAMWAKADEAGFKRDKTGGYDPDSSEWALDEDSVAQIKSLCQQLLSLVSGGDGSALPNAEPAPLPDAAASTSGMPGVTGMSATVMSALASLGKRVERIEAKEANAHRAGIKARLEAVKAAGVDSTGEVERMLAGIDTVKMSVGANGEHSLGDTETALRIWESVAGTNQLTRAVTGGPAGANPAPYPASVHMGVGGVTAGAGESWADGYNARRFPAGKKAV